MPTIFEIAFGELADAQEAFAGVPLTYFAAAGAEVAIALAVPGRAVHRLGREPGAAPIRRYDQTWVIRAADLVDDNDQPFAPSLGDWVEIDDADGNPQRYDLVRPQAGEGVCFDWVEGQTRVRIYGLRAGAAEV